MSDKLEEMEKEKNSKLDCIKKLQEMDFPEPKDLSDPKYIKEFKEAVAEHDKMIKQYQKISLKSLYTPMDF